MSQKKWEKKLHQLKSQALKLRTVPASRKNQVLRKVASLLLARQAEILRANSLDVEKMKSQGGFQSALLDRLLLNPKRIAQMAQSLKEVAALSDPVGEVAEERTLSNGIILQRVRSPLGVIFMIFESRPNVAIEAFSLAFKSGNVIILRGGKEAMHTTAVLYKILREALSNSGLSPDLFWGIEDPDRAIPNFLLQQKNWIDVVVPRGGSQLIDFVTSHSQIPVIKHDRGLCHIYVHADASIEMASEVVINAKTQRPGVCNAMETLLVHEKVARRFLLDLYPRLKSQGVRLHACPRTRSILKNEKIQKATKSSWDTEYLDLDLNCRVVGSLEAAIQHIEDHGSRHSEAVITKSEKVAEKFQKEVDAAAVYWNCSTRFTDGFEMGLGGELGISTQKLHVRGPVGLRELTSLRWLGRGSGQVRV